ncbi:MAG: Holliday junction branch migration protein RuvA [Robiginitomaculum sp.]
MIGILTGTILVIGLGQVILDVTGVGYLVQCGGSTLGTLSIGEVASLHIETHVRETAITLYGFADDEERAWFVRLQSVQKVGPKAALAILDIMRPDEIINAVALENKVAFNAAKGVGPALAGRIVLDLSGKAPPQGRNMGLAMSTHHGDTKSEGSLTTNASALQRDAISALTGLGIDQSKAMRAVASALLSRDDLDLNALVKQALKEVHT